MGNWVHTCTEDASDATDASSVTNNLQHRWFCWYAHSIQHGCHCNPRSEDVGKEDNLQMVYLFHIGVSQLGLVYCGRGGGVAVHITHMYCTSTINGRAGNWNFYLYVPRSPNHIFLSQWFTKCQLSLIRDEFSFCDTIMHLHRPWLYGVSTCAIWSPTISHEDCDHF